MPKRVLAAFALSAALAASVLAGCGGDDAGSAATATSAGPTTASLATTTSKPPLVATTPATASTTASTAPATTAPPTTAAADEIESFGDAETAADALFDAWVAGDEERAREVAPGDVVDSLFRVDGSGADETYTDQGCILDPDGGDDVLCQWRYEGGAMSIVVTPNAGEDTFRITDIRFIAD